MLIEHMSNGYLYESFAGALHICWDTLYHWEQRFPEFVEAKNIGIAEGLRHDEMLLEAGIRGLKKLKDGSPISINPALLIWRMKNRFPKFYKDKQSISYLDETEYPEVK